MKRGVKPRPYQSKVRVESARRTRRAILDAARALLVERGYGTMTMQAVAASAGVALDTVYAVVGTKPALARLIIETALSGGDEAVPAEEREYVRRIRAAPTAREKLSIYAAALPPINARLAPLVRAFREAAAQHVELATLWREVSDRRARNMRLLADELVATGEVRPELAARRIADVLWALNSPELYDLLVRGRGWPPEELGAWLADAWSRLLLRPAKLKSSAQPRTRRGKEPTLLDRR